MSNTDYREDSRDSWHSEDDCRDAPSTASTSPSQRLLRETSMPENCKRRVDLATTGEGLSGGRCLIENTDQVNAVYYTHCLARGTKDHILDALEFSWGMPHHTLNLDTRYNVFRLGSKFHALYGKNSPMCILFPEEHIIQQYYNARKDRNKFPIINEPSYKYNFLAHDDMASVPIHRLTPPDNLAAAPPAAAYAHFAHPYATFGLVISHLHPRFVICDAGKKISTTTTFLAFSRMHPNRARTLLMVAEIWEAWTNIARNPDFRAFRKEPYTGENMSSTSKRTVTRRLFPSVKKHRGDHHKYP